MTFSDLVSAVILDSGRPDMTFVEDGGDGQIPQKIANSTAYLHTLDFFKKDIIPVQVQFDQAAFIQVLDKNDFPRYRRLAYARKNDPTLSSFQQNPTILPPLFNSAGAVNFQQSMPMFEIISADQIFDEYGYGSEKLDVLYEAGDSLYFKSSSSFQNVLFGFYQFPNVDVSNRGANYSSWIAIDYPYAIIDHAVSAIFAASGKNEASRKYDTDRIPKWINNILISNVETAGR